MPSCKLPLTFLLFALLCVGPAWAGAEGTEDERKAARQARKEARKAEAARKSADPNRTEPSLFPGVGYDSNRGIGFGAVGNVTKLKEGLAPWRYRLDGTIWFYADLSPEGTPEITYMYDYLDFDWLISSQVRWQSRVWFRRETDVGWYGLGNASEAARPWQAIDADADPEAWARARRFHEYDHIYPGLRTNLRVGLVGPLEAFGGASLIWNWVNLYPGSQLERDLGGGAGAETQEALVGVGRHGVLQGQVGLVADGRDQELDPRRGWMVEASVRGGGVFEDPAGYAGLNSHLRLYIPVLPDRITLAGRVMGDLLFGRPPFYMLGRFGGLRPDDGIAGQLGIRGPPSRRYHGMGKLIASLELRTRLFTVRALGRPATVGLNAFVDGGRVWADGTGGNALDGTGAGLQGAIGVGGRLRFGDGFMVRADIGWSPEGTAIYVDVDHTF